MKKTQNNYVLVITAMKMDQRQTELLKIISLSPQKIKPGSSG
jgi:hypothetical protein